jgi:hypothetical protein
MRSPQGVWVVDLLGRDGIFVNETHVRFARLDDGDELRIGRHILRLRIDEGPGRRTELALPSASRVLARRVSDHPSSYRTLPAMPAPPSSSVPLAPTWHYPEHEIHRVLAERHGNQTEMIQALLQPLVQQFGLMQQQMFEQFHQAMMGMFQSFGAMYREQMTDLREELDEVRRLTQELQELQTEIQRREASGSKTAGTSAPSAEPALPERSTSTTKTKTRAHSPSKSRPTAAASASASARDEEPLLRKPPPTKSDVGVHSVLLERIHQLQNERQSRWQKILGLLNRAPQSGG